MVKTDFRVLEKFEGYRGQNFGVITQRRRGSIPLFLSFFSYLLSELPGMLLNDDLWSSAIDLQRRERWTEFFSERIVEEVLMELAKSEGEEVAKLIRKTNLAEKIKEKVLKEWKKEEGEFAELIREDRLSEFKPFASFEAERLFRHFKKELKEFAKEKEKAFRKMRKSLVTKGETEISTMSPANLPFVERGFVYLRPLSPVHSALYVNLKAVSPSTTYLEIELGLIHESLLGIKSEIADFLTLRLLKGETSPEGLTVIYAPICPVCGNLSEDAKLCKTCRADKHFLMKTFEFMEYWEKEAFLNGTLTKETLQDIWGRIKVSNPKLAYRLDKLYQKAKFLKPYLQEEIDYKISLLEGNQTSPFVEY